MIKIESKSQNLKLLKKLRRIKYFQNNNRQKIKWEYTYMNDPIRIKICELEHVIRTLHF